MDSPISDFLWYWFVCRLRKGERGNYIEMLETGSSRGSHLLDKKGGQVSLISFCADKTSYVDRSCREFHKDQSKSEKIILDLVEESGKMKTDILRVISIGRRLFHTCCCHSLSESLIRH